MIERRHPRSIFGIRLAAIAVIFTVAMWGGHHAQALPGPECKDQWMGCAESCEPEECEVIPGCPGTIKCIACSDGDRGHICEVEKVE